MHNWLALDDTDHLLSTHCLCLLRPFSLFFWNDPWTLGGGDVTQMSHLGPGILYVFVLCALVIYGSLTYIHRIHPLKATTSLSDKRINLRDIMLREPGTEREILHKFMLMWKLKAKAKIIGIKSWMVDEVRKRNREKQAKVKVCCYMELMRNQCQCFSLQLVAVKLAKNKFYLLFWHTKN